MYDKKETGMPVSFCILSESKKWLLGPNKTLNLYIEKCVICSMIREINSVGERHGKLICYGTGRTN